jgi:hypothetical protein
VVVATHDGKIPKIIPLSTHDLQNKQKIQYGKPHTPIENYDTQGHNKDEKMTKNLNNNREMLENVHKISSRKPTYH